jgi:hypothetical protein
METKPDTDELSDEAPYSVIKDSYPLHYLAWKGEHKLLSKKITGMCNLLAISLEKR